MKDIKNNMLKTDVERQRKCGNEEKERSIIRCKEI